GGALAGAAVLPRCSEDLQDACRDRLGWGIACDADLEVVAALSARPSFPASVENCRMTVGIDLIEIERVRRALERYPSFRQRCFTEAERAYCDSRPNPPQHYAARFAGKEAIGKALGFGVARAFAWQEVEIAGRPKPG